MELTTLTGNQEKTTRLSAVLFLYFIPINILYNWAVQTACFVKMRLMLIFHLSSQLQF